MSAGAWDGRPENPERTGWHWVAGDYTGAAVEVAFWRADAQDWQRAGRSCSWFANEMHSRYLGLCLLPADAATLRDLLKRALDHAERVSVLLNDVAAEMHRLGEAEPEGSARFDAMSVLLCRRFTDCSALALMIDAQKAGIELPIDLASSAAA
jgi:hypothetical protein